jgi:hypothetical protein
VSINRFTLFLGSAVLFLVLGPVADAGSRDAFKIKAPIVKAAAAGASNLKTFTFSLYEHLKLNKLGLSIQALEYAYKGYEYLLHRGELDNPNILTICDFSQSSFRKRMYVIDVRRQKLLINTYVAHGRNSGGEYATHFSNNPESLQSSLGFYVTERTYKGKHGTSLRIDGQEPGFNDRAEDRAIVVHGAPYVGHSLTGRSWGCPAVPQNQIRKVINTIKNGSCFFIYHPSNSYLHGSRILNS